ncbi:hypothetical protein TA3x_002130 [Tundrisphaera sp. TA3]|uniref:hypothetical protein n=1 Tax=Tundrisphaera sp. TA3 TaxID=3435775 RepID=UPI003EBA08AC
MFVRNRPALLVASLALVVAASTTAPAEDIYVENGVYVKQLPPWRQRLLQKRMLRQSGAAEVVIQGPPAVRVPGPPASRRSMRPLFGPVRYPATIIEPAGDPVVVTGPKVISSKPGVVVESPTRIKAEPPVVVEEELDELPPVDLPPARERAPLPAPAAAPAPGAVISTPATKPAAPPLELEPEPPLAAPASAPASGALPKPKRSA